MNKSDLKNIKVILATDCGSTTTKAILIQKIDGQYRQTHGGKPPHLSKNLLPMSLLALSML